MSAVQAKLQKSLARFKERISNGSYYEAQQTIRSITNRYIHAKNYNAAVELLYQSSMILMEFKKYDEASDLFLFMIEVFEKDNKSAHDFKNQDLVKLIDFLNALPNDDANLLNLSKEISKFVQKKTGDEVGYTNLNFILGKKLYYSGTPELVAKSETFLFLSGSTNEESLDLLIELVFQSYLKDDSEENQFGFYVARLVLPYLTLFNLKYANSSLTKMIAKAKSTPKGSSLEFTTTGDIAILNDADDSGKLINFLSLLIALIERASTENGTNFKVLVNRYKPQLSKYEPLLPKLNTIGQLYFNVTIIQQQNNMLAQMMSGFLGGGN